MTNDNISSVDKNIYSELSKHKISFGYREKLLGSCISSFLDWVFSHSAKILAFP